MEHDANSIIELLETTGTKFSGVIRELENCDATTIIEWITEALDLIYEGKGPPECDTCDDDNGGYMDDGFVKTLGATNGACLVTAVIAQWILRFMCNKLMQLMTPESAILNRKYAICITYVFMYHFDFQVYSYFILRNVFKLSNPL